MMRTLDVLVLRLAVRAGVSTGSRPDSPTGVGWPRTRDTTTWLVMRVCGTAVRTSRFLGGCGLLGLRDHGDSLRSLVACVSGRGLVARGLVARRCAALHFSRLHPQHKQQLHGQPPSASSPRSTLDIPLDHGGGRGPSFLARQPGRRSEGRTLASRAPARCPPLTPSVSGRPGLGCEKRRLQPPVRAPTCGSSGIRLAAAHLTHPPPVCGAPLDSCGNFRACKLLIHAQHSWRDLEDDRRSVQT